MKYTKYQLHDMSDLEVNRALALAMNKYDGVVGEWMPNGVKVNDDSGFFYSECDYCNNWNDVMPLAVEHGISLIENDDGYSAYQNFSIYEDINYRIEHGAHFGDEKPQRAIACCLILDLQEKQ